LNLTWKAAILGKRFSRFVSTTTLSLILVMQAPRTHMWCNWSSKRLLRTNLLMLLATKVSKVRSSSTSILPDAHWMHFDFLVMWVWNQFSYSCSVVVLELPTYSAMVGDLADSWCAALHSKDGKSGTSSRAGWLYNSPIQLQPPQSHLMPRGLQSPTLSFFFFPVSHFEVRVFFFSLQLSEYLACYNCTIAHGA